LFTVDEVLEWLKFESILDVENVKCQGEWFFMFIM
jgi:hypothetical protein